MLKKSGLARVRVLGADQKKKRALGTRLKFWKDMGLKKK